MSNVARLLLVKIDYFYRIHFLLTYSSTRKKFPTPAGLLPRNDIVNFNVKFLLDISKKEKLNALYMKMHIGIKKGK